MTPEELRAAARDVFAGAPTKVNLAQARALVGLLERGACAGHRAGDGTILDHDPEGAPRVLAIGGAYSTEDLDGGPTTTALAVVSDDGRMWPVVGAGIAWVPADVRDAGSASAGAAINPRCGALQPDARR